MRRGKVLWNGDDLSRGQFPDFCVAFAKLPKNLYRVSARLNCQMAQLRRFSVIPDGMINKPYRCAVNFGRNKHFVGRGLRIRGDVVVIKDRSIPNIKSVETLRKL